MLTLPARSNDERAMIQVGDANNLRGSGFAARRTVFLKHGHFFRLFARA
ncbi:MAG: hypothetical protein ACYCY9_07725 [Thiobacillus sp.]